MDLDNRKYEFRVFGWILKLDFYSLNYISKICFIFLVFQILRHVISKLAGNREYVIKICAATKSLSETYVYGLPSEESRIFLPEENCQMRTTSFQESIPAELSAGMIVGAVCSCFFLLAAVIGYIIWR